jgi:hypothetical protein
MRGKYVLITITHHTYWYRDTETSKAVWLLYGWIRGAENEPIAEIEDKLTAFTRAHSYGVPVVLGDGDWLYPLCDWLETYLPKD